MHALMLGIVGLSIVVAVVQLITGWGWGSPLVPLPFLVLLALNSWRQFRMGVYVDGDTVRVIGFWPGRSRTVAWAQVIRVVSRVHRAAAGAEGIHLILVDGTAVPTPLVLAPADRQLPTLRATLREIGIAKVPLVWQEGREYKVALRRLRRCHARVAHRTSGSAAVTSHNQPTYPVRPHREERRVRLPVSPVQEVVRRRLFRRARR